jgi:hypothetical protein
VKVKAKSSMKVKAKSSMKEGRQKAFLAAFTELGNITDAAKKAKVLRQSHYEWMQDEEYARKFENAMEVAMDGLEGHAYRRASIGIQSDVFQGGVKVGVKREYSDTLLMFLLNGRRPHVFRPRKGDDAAAKKARRVPLLKNVSDEDLLLLRDIAARASEPVETPK